MVLNTEWAQVEVIDLINDGSGLAFGIIGGRSTGVVVKTILPGGVADRDGRLQSGDHILQIGDVNLRGLGSEQAASVLRQCGVHVRMVVARPVEPTASDYRALGSHAPIVPTKLLGDPDELDRHLLENGYSDAFCHPTSGTYDPYIYSRDQSDLHPTSGIVDIVKDPIPIGPIPLVPTPRIEAPTVELLPLDMALLGSPPPDTETFVVELRKDDYGLGITVAGYVCEQEELSGIFVKSISSGSAAGLSGKVHINDRIVQVNEISLQGYTNHQAVEVLRNTGSIVKLRLERFLRGPKYEQLQQAIKANQLKPSSPPSPSVSSLPKFSIHTDMYSYTEIDLEGESHTTMNSSVLIDQVTPINEESEIVIDSPCPLTLLPIISEEDNTIKKRWQEILQRDLDIIIAHLIKDNKRGLGISLEGTVDVEDGKEVRPHHYIRSILPDGPVGVNSLLESGDELLEVNGKCLFGLNHLEVVRILKSLPEKVVLVCARHSENSVPRVINTSQNRAAFATRSILGGSLQNLIPSSDQNKLVKAKSDSSLASSIATLGELSSNRSKSRSLEPITGLAAWSEDSQIVELTKSDRGLGFSILDYQDPLNPNETVIVIRSLVPGGVAQQDGRLIPGDRLLAVNDIPLARASLDKAVQVLKGAPKGLVRIEVAKPLNDTVSQSSPVSSVSFQECMDSENENTGLEDYQECIEEYQEGLEVVQICMDEENSLIPISKESSVSTFTKKSPTKYSQRNLKNKRSTQEQNGIPASEIEHKYKKEISNCLRIVDSSDEKDGYETCLDEFEETTLTCKKNLKNIEDHKDGKQFSKKDHVCLENNYINDGLKSYDDPTDSFGGDQFFLVEYIDDDPNSERILSSSIIKNEIEVDNEDKVLTKQEHDKKYGVVDDLDDTCDETLKEELVQVIENDYQYILKSKEPKRYVRCLSEYYNDYEECLEEYRAYGNIEKQEEEEKIPSKETLDECELSEEFSMEESYKVDSLGLGAKFSSAPALLDLFCICTYDPGPDVDRNRRKSMNVPRGGRQSEHNSMTVTRTSDGGVSLIVDGCTMSNNHWGPQRLVEVPRPQTGNSLGISIVGGKVDLYNSETVLGIFVKNVVTDSPAGITGALKTGDRIIEVDGVDLRYASHEKAVEAIRSAGDPVMFLVQSLVPWGAGNSEIVDKNTVESDEINKGPLVETDEIHEEVEVMSADIIPTEIIPAEAILVETIPAGIIPAGTVYTETIPTEIITEKTIPTEIIIGETIPAKLIPEKLIPAETIPEKEIPAEKNSEKLIPAEKFPEKEIPAETIPESIISEKNTSQVISNQKEDKEDKIIKEEEQTIIEEEHKPSQMNGIPETVEPEAEDNNPTQIPNGIPTINEPKTVYSDESSEESSDDEDTRDLEGRTYTKKGEQEVKPPVTIVVAPVKRKIVPVEIDRASAGNIKRSPEEIKMDKEEEDEFGYTTNKVKKKYSSLGGSVIMVQLERGPNGSLGLSLAGHRDRSTMAVFVVGLNPSGAAHRLGPAGIQVGDEILEINGVVLHGRCHLNASAIIKGLSGPVFKVIALRRKTALEELAVRPITQFPVSLEDETAEEKYSNFKNVRTVTIKKGTQSLGIMIIEGKHAEVGQGIFISDIQEGSPAEQAGLDIGDMILAVNKDTLIGASYDTAANLLKKTEGLVVLVVCNPNKRLDTNGSETVPLGAKTPSRPPSSADKLKTSAPPSRPTTPINEPVADPTSCPIIPGKEVFIEITTEGKALGFSFVGGKDTLISEGIIVHEIYPNGALAKDGRVKPGDQILEINSEKLTDVTNITASSIIRQIMTKVRLIIYRPENIQYSTIDIEFVKKPGKGIGLSVMPRKTDPGVYVSEILHGSLADLDGRIIRGDILCSVNGTDLKSATAEQAAVVLKTVSGRVSLKFNRYKVSTR